MVSCYEINPGLYGVMKIVGSVAGLRITVISRCNLCCWTRNYPTPITWHTTQLPPLIESNQDFSQLKLSHRESCPYLSMSQQVTVGNTWQVKARAMSLFTRPDWQSAPVVWPDQTALSSWGWFLLSQSERQKGSICVWIVSSNNLEDFSYQARTLKPSSSGWWDSLTKYEAAWSYSGFLLGEN